MQRDDALLHQREPREADEHRDEGDAVEANKVKYRMKEHHYEPGYIAIADCMWGNAEYGLEPPVEMEGLPLHLVKVSNATNGHYGEMAGGQPWVLTDGVVNPDCSRDQC